MGDEIVALFFGGISGPNHAAAAVAAAVIWASAPRAQTPLRRAPIPMGTAVHTGEAFVGGTGPAGTSSAMSSTRLRDSHRPRGRAR